MATDTQGGDSADINVDIPCRMCGEMVRKGSVRCRECGAFIDPDIERKSGELDSVGGGDDDDFEVAEGVATFFAGESAFELAVDSLESAAPDPPVADLIEDPLAEDPLAEDPLSEGADVSEPGSDAPAPPTGEVSDAGSPEGPPTQDATGDALFSSALEEENEAKRRQREQFGRVLSQVPESGVVVYCPSGHRIHVADKYRGRAGRCPQCRAPFLVPGQPTETPQQVEEEEEVQENEDAVIFVREDSGRYGVWLPDVRLHKTQVSKIKLKVGSLSDEAETIDIGFSDDGLLIVTVFKGRGGLTSRAAERKKPDVRAEVFKHLHTCRRKSDPGQIPAPGFFRLKPEHLQDIWIAQPAPPRGESLFADLNLFGDGLIGIRIPNLEKSEERLYLTLTLSQYREFARLMAEKYEIVLPSQEHGIPITDEFDEAVCHYSEQKLAPLKHMEFYAADPLLETEIIGRKCQTCGIAVSELAREREKLGGKNGSGIAKAKCPACSQKFGSISLVGLKAKETDTPGSNNDADA